MPRHTQVFLGTMYWNFLYMQVANGGTSLLGTASNRANPFTKICDAAARLASTNLLSFEVCQP